MRTALEIGASTPEKARREVAGASRRAIRTRPAHRQHAELLHAELGNPLVV